MDLETDESTRATADGEIETEMTMTSYEPLKERRMKRDARWPTMSWMMNGVLTTWWLLKDLRMTTFDEIQKDEKKRDDDWLDESM